MKLKTLIQSLILSHICRLSRALSKAKAISVQILKDMQLVHNLMEPLLLKKSKKKTQLFLGSFRMHYNWCSSTTQVMLPMMQGEAAPSPIYLYCGSYDSDQLADSPELSGYLNWLDLEKDHDQESDDIISHDIHVQLHDDDVDRLADAFIASCREKFRLEKQESYRRFQEMMARSV